MYIYIYIFIYIYIYIYSCPFKKHIVTGSAICFTCTFF